MHALLAILALVGSPGLAEQDDSDPANGIRALLARQQEDWNRGDLDAFVDGYRKSPDAVFQSGGAQTRGVDALRERYRLRYKEGGRSMGRLSFTEVEVEELGPDSGLARGRWQLTMPDDQKLGGLFTVVVRRGNEGWRIVHDHTSSDEPR